MVTGLQRDVLVYLLQYGNDAPSNIADAIDTNSKYVSQMLDSLESEGLVNPRGAGVWTLTEDGVELARAIAREQDGQGDL